MSRFPDAALYGLHPHVHSSARLTAGELCAVTEISTPVSPHSSRRRFDRSGHSRITRRYCRERAPKQFRLRTLRCHQPRRRSQDKICPLPRRLYFRECRTACQRRTGDSASRQNRQRDRSASSLRDNHKRQHSKPAALYQIKFSPHRKVRGFL